MLIVFLAAFQQSLSGFGFALVAMPLLVQLLGIQAAAPLVAALALTLNIVNSIRWRRALDFREIRRLGIWMALGVPVGVWGAFALNETVVKAGLGVLLVAYAIYALTRPQELPTISQRWAYPAGFLAGVLGGAYNTAGPPLILYGNLRNWSHERFRAVLQGVFALSASLVVSGHLLARHFTPHVMGWLGPAVVAVLSGVALGAITDRHLKPQHVRTWITLLTLILGVSLFF